MDYVTIVSVEAAGVADHKSDFKKKEEKELSDSSVESQFITVLAINGEISEERELLTVTREPGEKLGFGLKFYGGNSGSNEPVKKLFIQSCAANTPASRTSASWGSLGEGDEILKINGLPVNTMSRLECVKNLKESVDYIKLFVRHGTGKIEMPERALGRSSSLKKPPTPPQAPPRKVLKRNSSYPEPGTVSYPIATEEDLFNVPPPADFYLNTVDDYARGFDSDDTGSTISTVIDRFIMDTTDLKTAHSQQLANALKPFTLLEQEFNIQAENTLRPAETVKQLDNRQDVVKLEVNNYENVKVSESREKQNNYENVELKIPKSELNSYENMLFDQVKPSKIPVNTPPVPKPRQQAPPVKPRKRTQIPVQSNVYKSSVQSETDDFFENSVHEYKTIENWLQETDATEDKVPDEECQSEILPRCVEFLPKSLQTNSRFAIKQCIKISDSQQEHYLSSSDEDPEEQEKVYEPIEVENNGLTSGEKLGPLELLEGPGPTEAYFNGFQWTNHALTLPTCWEVEEEPSSLEPQTGCGVIINTENVVDGDKQPHQQRQQLSGLSTAAPGKEEKVMSSTVTVSSAMIKTETQYLVSTQSATTSAIRRDNGVGKNDGPIMNQPESAVVNGVTLLDQSMMGSAINLGEGRIRIKNIHEIPAAASKAVSPSSTINGMPRAINGNDKALLLSVTNIDEIRMSTNSPNNCEAAKQRPGLPEKDGSSVGECKLGGVGKSPPPPSVSNRVTTVVSSTSLDQNNNMYQEGALSNSLKPDESSENCDRGEDEEKLRDCVQGIDTSTAIAAAINNGNHVRNNNNTIEPRSVINGLTKTEIQQQQQQQQQPESGNGDCDKASVSSAGQKSVGNVIEEAESEIAEITNEKVNQFAQLERRIILGGSATEIAIENSNLTSGNNNNLAAVINHHQSEAAAKVHPLLFGNSDRKGVMICDTAVNRSDENQVSEKMDSITDSVTAAEENVDAATSSSSSLLLSGPEVLVCREEKEGASEAVPEIRGGEGHIIDRCEFDLTDVGQLVKLAGGCRDADQVDYRAAEEEKSTSETTVEIAPAETEQEADVTEEKEMDRGLVSLVSNNSSSSISSSNLIANKSSSPMSGPLLMSPPTFSRLPPDGHEFPPNFAEPHVMMANNNHQVPGATITKSQINSKVVESTMKISSRHLLEELPAPPTTAPPQCPKLGRISTNGSASAFVEMRRKSIETNGDSGYLRGSPVTPLGVIKMKGSEWRKDEKSEKSVRDKIAMFSNDTPSPTTENKSPNGLRKAWNRSTDDLLSASGANSYQGFIGDHSSSNSPSTPRRESLAKKARSVENLDDCVDGQPPIPSYITMPKDEEIAPYRPTFKKTYSVDVLNDPAMNDQPVYYKPLNEDLSSKYASLPRRINGMSSSLTASNPQLTRTTSFSGSTDSPNGTDRRRSSISNMLEQRKKSMSKLRGLIIPEKSAGFETKQESILFDLPEIKSADFDKVPQKLNSPNLSLNGSGRTKPATNERRSQIQYNLKEINPPVRPGYHASLSEPAAPLGRSYQSIFESSRRSFGGPGVPVILGSKKGPTDDKLTQGTALPPTKPPRTSLIYTPHRSNLMDDSEDSDYLASLQSSRISTPPQSPVAKTNVLAVPEKLPLTRTLSSETNTSIASSTASTLTSGSGSQASCSSMGSTPTGPHSTRKVVKGVPQIDSSMNRKSVLASAKTRNGNAKSLLDEQGNAQGGRFEDEDSTDGYDEDRQVFKRPKPKQRTMQQQNGNGLTNYKLVSGKETGKDRVINVATCVEVVEEMPLSETPIETVITMTSQLILSEQKEAEKNNAATKNTDAEAVSQKSSTSESEPEMNDLVKWVRTEAAKTNSGHTVNRRSERKEKSIPSSPSPVLDRPIVSAKKLTTADLRKQFELKANSVGPGSGMKLGPITPPVKEKANFHDRFSSWESVASNSSSGISSMPTRSIPCSETAQSTPTDFGSFTSIGSSHSLLTAQDLQAIIEEADPPLKTPDAFVIVLQRESPESSIGITLAGGADYEAKEITVHKVLTASPAEKDGRLKKGDRILAINGLSMRGLTHRESVTVLKTPRSEVVLAVTRSPSATAAGSVMGKAKRPSLGSLSSLLERDCDETETKKATGYHKTSRSLDMDAMICDGDSVCSSELLDERNPLDGDTIVVPVTFKRLMTTPMGAQEVEIFKDTCGLGFSIEGGFDSPLGNCPLTVKKVFMGGAAEKSGLIRSGNEIVAINGYTTSNMTRVSAWNYMKKLPLGSVRIVIL